jgi:hypothetical protein
LGLRGTGKSSLLEHIGEGYLESGHAIFDLFASRDAESLAWLRSSHAKDKKVLLLKGENVDVKCGFTVKNAEAVTLDDFEKHDIIISSSPLYLSIDQEFTSAGRLTDLLYRRLSYKRLIYMLTREASNLFYSRLKLCDNQLDAKSQMIYMLREMRHCGIALGLDSLRFTSVDIDIRSLADLTLLKSQGVMGLSHDLQWLYSFFNPVMVRSMPVKNFFVVSKSGALGIGEFPFPSWHKREKENILHELDIHIEYGEPLKEGENKGTFRTVGDSEHADIVKLYSEGYGYESIAQQLNRSSRTPLVHIRAHNDTVHRLGYCPICKRVGSIYQDKRAEKSVIKEA